MINVLFLHTQLSGYFVSSLKFAVEKNENLLIHVVVFPNTKDAPFNFSSFHKRIKVYNRSDLKLDDIENLIDLISPKSIYVTGWSDREYLRVIKKYKKKITLTISVDNMWYGSARQYIAFILSRLFLVNLFDFVWVPGEPQARYVKKLGFKTKNILFNYYCADIERFSDYYNEAKTSKEKNFPHKFLFVGRYVKEKGIVDLWKAFEKLQQEFPNDWELVCVGAGPLFESRMKMDKIDHRGFLSPEDLQPLIDETGVFILPSVEEHWGVVLHEYAAAGYPLICSKEVGAVGAFLKDQSNGFVFDSKNIDSLKDKMHKITNLSDAELHKMSIQSIKQSKSISKEKWYESFNEINQYLQCNL